MGYCRAVVVGSHVYVAGTAPIPPDGSPPPEGAYEQTKLCLEIIGTALEKAGASFEHVVRSRIYITDPAYFQDVARAHGEVFARDPPGEHDRLHRALRPGLEGRDRRGRAASMTGKQAFPPSITGKGAVHTGSVLDHAFGQGEPYTLGVEEEYQLLDGRTFDLVQHIETMLDAIAGHELEERINPELMQSVIEITTPVCRTRGRRASAS